uniref:Uncharacterized protein n=1 Tax=Anopheles merus TaxID=30066 RepID=A0A182UM38_ANOME
MCIQPDHLDDPELFLLGPEAPLWPPVEEDHPGADHDSDENNESSVESSQEGEALLMQGAGEQDREMEEQMVEPAEAEQQSGAGPSVEPGPGEHGQDQMMPEPAPEAAGAGSQPGTIVSGAGGIVPPLDIGPYEIMQLSSLVDYLLEQLEDPDVQSFYKTRHDFILLRYVNKECSALEAYTMLMDLQHETLQLVKMTKIVMYGM